MGVEAVAGFVTDVADQAVVLPTIVAVALALLVQRRWGSVAAWLFAMGAVLGTMLVLKVFSFACGWQVPVLGPRLLDLRSPSGHTASAAAAVGGVAALLYPGRVAVSVWSALAAAVVIGTTRLVLQVHSMSEVLVGGVVGIAGAYLLARLLPPGRWRAGPVLAAVTFVVVLLHGHHLPAEAALQVRGTALVRAAVPACRPPVSLAL